MAATVITHPEQRQSCINIGGARISADRVIKEPAKTVAITSALREPSPDAVSFLSMDELLGANVLGYAPPPAPLKVIPVVSIPEETETRGWDFDIAAE